MIRWFRRLLPRHATYRTEIADEIAYHLEERTRALVAQGLSPRIARAQAEQEFGSLAEARRELATIDGRHARTLQSRSWRTDVLGDLRLGFRMLRRSPGFSTLLIIILALAIGANSASFTVLRSALVKGLPYAEPGQLVHLWETTPEGSQPGGDLHRTEASYPDFVDWREQTTSFTALEGYDQTNLTIASSEGVLMRRGAYVTPGFFSLLGIRPLAGRDFRPEENVPDGLPIALLSYGFWQSRFGGDRSALDSTLLLDGRPFTIIGVLPPDFHFAPIGDADVWMPLNADAILRTLRFNHWLRVIGRIQPGVSAERAQSDISLVMNRLASQYPETNQGRDAVLVPLREELIGKVEPVLVALFVAMGLVLLIACANIASLLLARTLGREQEIQVRVALGATRWRLARQLLAESLVFVVAGTMLGIALGQAGLHWVLGALPEGVLDHLPALRESRLDGTVLGYTVLLAVGTGLAFGIGPILHAFGASHAAGSGGQRSTGHFRLRRLRDALIVGEIALTLVLLAGTALVGRSLLSLVSQELGFSTEGIYTARVALGGPAYSTDAPNQRFFERLIAEVGALPGVSSVGAVSQLPLNGGGTNTIHLEGTPELPAPERPAATNRQVVGDYFQTITVPLIGGRLLTPRDDSLAPRVVLVSETLARTLEPSGTVLGRSIRFYSNPAVTWEIVGIVGDVRTGSLEAAPPPTLYLTHLQASNNRMSLVIRTSLTESTVAQRVREIVRALDPAVPVYSSGRLQQIVNDAPAVASRRVPFLLLSIFAGSALILAVVGLYGVVSYSVARRTRELGIRMALGAAPGQIRSDVLRYGTGLAIAGTVIGVMVALALSRFLAGLLYGVGPLDPIAYAGAALLLITVTLVASLLPAHRATRVDPAIALRA